MSTSTENTQDLSSGGNEDSLKQHQHTFPARLMALPVVSDSWDYAQHLYEKSKGYRVLSVGLSVAECSLKTAVRVATPLASPLLGYVEPLDQWACRRLDDVEKMAPVITKPSKEVLSATRDGVLRVVAGGDTPVPPTLSAAVSTRASRLVKQAEEVVTEKATTVSTFTHRVLDGAHDLLDPYLPEETRDAHRIDTCEGSLTGKTAALANKTTSHFCSSIHTRIHPECTSEPILSHVVAACVEVIRSKWEGQSGGEQQQQQQQQGQNRGGQLAFQVLMFAFNVTVGVINFTLVMTVYITGKLHAAVVKKRRSEEGEEATIPLDQPKQDDKNGYLKED